MIFNSFATIRNYLVSLILLTTMDKPQSKVYQHFSIHPDGRRQCNHCQSENKEKIYAKSSPTTPLWNHIKKYHPDKLESQEETELPLSQAQQNTITEAYIKWIVNDLQPFTTSDNDDFIEFIKLLNKKYVIPCRQTTQKLVITKYNSYKELVQEILQTIPGMISLTSDIWTSDTSDSYCGITAHFIDKRWRLGYLILNIRFVILSLFYLISKLFTYL